MSSVTEYFRLLYTLQHHMVDRLIQYSSVEPTSTNTNNTKILSIMLRGGSYVNLLDIMTDLPFYTLVAS